MYIYILLNIFTLLFPLILSFDRKVYFFQYWRALFPSIVLVGTMFIIWDVWFTGIGVWEFNPAYILGIYFINLPLEEWLFFLTVPYACVFIYECLAAYFKENWSSTRMRYIYLFLGISVIVLGLANLDKLYTAITFLTVGVLLLLSALFTPRYLGRFAQMYVVHLIPFFLINGILTALPVVIYNNAENLHLRIGTIPVEDPFYSMLMLLLIVHLYEFLKKKFHLNAQLNSIY